MLNDIKEFFVNSFINILVNIYICLGFILLMTVFFVNAHANTIAVNNLQNTKLKNFKLKNIELKNVNLPEAIRLTAKYLNMNVILSPQIQGEMIFNIANANPEEILNMLLVSNGLKKIRKGNVWLIASHNEIIKLKQEELKWKEMHEQSLMLVTRIWQIKYAKAEDIARLLQDDKANFLSKRGSVRVDNRTNVICIQDIISHIENIKRLIKRLDVPVQQIAIEARLVSIDSDFERELGIHFSPRQTIENENSNNSLSNPDKGQFNLAVIKLVQGSLLDVKLAALENAGHAELISSPSLFANNQQLASIEAGEEVPYQETSENGGTTIAFKKAVLGLKVTPQVLPKNNILLQLQINQDRPSNRMVQGMPTISTRQITTNVLAKSGETIVLGGIYEVSAENGVLGLPFLSRIPILGWLFQQHNTRRNKRELLIFVTPKVVGIEHA